MDLAFFEKEVDDIDGELAPFGHTDPAGRRGAGRRASDAQRRSLTNWNELRDWRVPVQDGDGLAATYGAEVLAQPGLQFGDANLLHDPIMTRNSHECHARRLPRLLAASSRYNGLRMTVAVDGHAAVNSIEVCTEAGTSPRAMRSNPNFGKKRSAVVVSR